MTVDELLKRGTALIDQLDGEGISQADQVSLCGGAMCAALMTLPRDEIRRRLDAHIAALASVLTDVKGAP